jgi:hypothetical protein
MKSFLLAGAALLLGATIVAPAMAEGPRASSENHWPGMQSVPQYYPADSQPQYVQPQYVWQEGYDRGGKWHGHWQLAQ